MNRGIFETTLGAVIIIVSFSFMAMVFSAQQPKPNDTYLLSMRFGSVQGLKINADVRLAGVPIGTVSEIKIDPQTLEALVNIEIAEQISLPTDSRAEIAAAGLLGENFVRLLPGQNKQYFQPNDQITETSDPASLEDLLGQAIFSLSEKK